MTTNGVNWKVAYTRHPGRWDNPINSVDFSEIVRCETGNNELESAFLTTFEPWTLSFLKQHFEHVATTLFATDRATEDYECCNCDRELRDAGGRAWTCNECDDDYMLCNDCVASQQEPSGGWAKQPVVPRAIC